MEEIKQEEHEVKKRRLTKNQQNSVNKYIKKNYDRVNLAIPKGYKETMKDFAEQNGLSLNQFLFYSACEKAGIEPPEYKQVYKA